jgi:predicted TIM-barrel fold metal-dependent hydrolase
MLIIDAHTHMGPMFDDRPGMFAGTHATDILDLMDSAGIDLACTFPPLWQGPVVIDPTFEQANAAIARETAAHRDRLLHFARVDPNFGEKALAEMDRCKEEYGCVGIKLHPSTEHFLPSNLRLMGPIFERCADWNWPVFFHAGYYPTCQPALFVPLAEEFPTVPIILAHIAYGHPADAIVVARRCPNIYLETSSNSTTVTMRQVFESIGPRQFVYGSDLPFSDPKDVLAKIRAVPGTTEEDLELILGGNMLRMLDLPETNTEEKLS